MSYVAVSPFHYCFPHPNTTSSQITWIYVDLLGYRPGAIWAYFINKLGFA